MSLRKLYALAVVLFMLSVVLTSGVAVWYTNTTVQHECSALRLLTATPYRPSPHKAQEEVYLFYKALVQWKDADHC